MILDEILIKSDFLQEKQYKRELQTKNEYCFATKIIINDWMSVNQSLIHNFILVQETLVDDFMWT
jgi:hypothetical protein